LRADQQVYEIFIGVNVMNPCCLYMNIYICRDVNYTDLVNDATNQHPINIHIPLIAAAPLYTTHCSARHCGVDTINIDIINPVMVSGTHNRTYRCAATKCATVHIQYNIAPFTSVRAKSEQFGNATNIVFDDIMPTL